MLELWQTEWCPASRRVRQRLTELGVAYLVHQVPVEKDDRIELQQATGADSIPVLVLKDGTIVVGEQEASRRSSAASTSRSPSRRKQKLTDRRRPRPAARYLEEECPVLATSYALTATTTLEHDEAVDRVRQELQEEGFGVLCEIDVSAKLNEKLGVDREPYMILGACMPPLAHRSLTLEPDLGALLPCNVAVYRLDGETHISAIDPERMLSIVDNPDLEPIASDVRQRLVNVVERAATG